MKIGDIKAEAIKLMFVNYDLPVTADNICDLEADETYNGYLVNMDGSINRALDRIAEKGRLDSKICVLPQDGEGVTLHGRFVRYALKTLLPDFGYVLRVVYDNGRFISPSVSYALEGKTLVLPALRGEDEEYRLLYSPRPPYVSKANRYADELDLPDEVAHLIPYFIKSELYAEEEPSQAAQARNLFESLLDESEDREQAPASLSVVFAQE